MININATLFIQLINFLILMVLLDRILFRPMLRILEERRERTEGRRRQAERIDAEAEAIWADYQEKIQQAKTEADRLRAQIIRRAEAERQKLLTQVAEESEKRLAEIRARVRGEMEEARKALEADARTLAQGMAEKLLGRRLA